MSFPYHDPNWCEVADFIHQHKTSAESVLANDIFWWRFDEIYRYANLHLEPERDYDYVVMHKGELRHFPDTFLNRLQQAYLPVLANPVFVVWTRGVNLPTVKNEHTRALAGLLALRKQTSFQPQPADDFVFPRPGRITKLEKLSKAGLAAAMDAFYDAGGYVYGTLRDKVFYNEIDRWLKTFWQGLEDSTVLDVACGNGRVARVIDAYTSLLEVDISAVAIRMAADAAKGDQRRLAQVMDAENLLLEDACFDVVTFIEGAEHVHDLSRALDEIIRVLRPGGALIMNCANADSLHQRLNRSLGYPYFKTNYQHICEPSWPELKAMLDAKGCAIDRAEGLFLYPYWGVPGVDQHVREVTDNDPRLVEALRQIGERAGPEYAYCFILKAIKR